MEEEERKSEVKKIGEGGVGSAEEAQGRRRLDRSGAEYEDARDREEGSGIGNGGWSGSTGGNYCLLPVRGGQPYRAAVPAADSAVGAAENLGADKRVPGVAVHETALTVNAGGLDAAKRAEEDFGRGALS